MKNKTRFYQFILFITLSCLSTLALAHPHHVDHLGYSAFSHGLLHPFTGLDHTLIIIAVGILTCRHAKQWPLLAVITTLVLCYGLAHGWETQHGFSLWLYTLGFMLSTGLLYFVGAMLGHFIFSKIVKKTDVKS